MAHSLLTAGRVGQHRRDQAVSKSLWTKISSDRPPSVHQCQHRLRQLPQSHDWTEAGVILVAIIGNPRKLRLLRAFVIAGCWDKFESLRVPAVSERAGQTANDVVDALECDWVRLAARDKIKECRRWEASLSAAMKDARRGARDTFVAKVSDDPHVLDETDSMGHGVWFWALTGGDFGIIDYLLHRHVSIHWPRGRNVLHMANYAAPQTVNYIFAKPGIASLVQQRDQYNDDDQWEVFYYTTVMGEKEWKVVKIDRNRLAHRLFMVGHPEELRGLVSVKSEGKGDELGERGQSEMAKAVVGCGSEKPDRCPLHSAVEAGNLELARALLRHGAGVNERDGFGMTALHTAAKCGHRRLVELLFNKGADLTLLDSTNSSALHIAQDNGHQRLQQLLRVP